MDLTKALLKEHSKAQAQYVADYIGDDPSHFRELFEVLMTGDTKLTQRAAWPIGLLGDSHPGLFYNYFPQMISCLQNPAHPAVSRNIYRTLQSLKIPDNYQGEVLELCLRDLMDPKIAVASKIFCMTVAYHISQNHPELQPELKLIIEEGLNHGSAGYHSRAKKILRKL